MAGRGRAAARVLALAVPLITVAAGCSADREAASAPAVDTIAVAGSVAAGPAVEAGRDIDRVAMVGDSITVGSTAELVDAFAAIGLTDVEINAESGRRMVSDGMITSGLDGVAAVLAAGEAPDLWVVALGTNDVANYPVEEYAAVITELLAAIPAGSPVVWVDCYLEDYQTRSAEFADVLRQVLADRGDATVVDWRTIAGEDGVLTDGVHPSDFGKGEFARRVAAAVASMG